MTYRCSSDIGLDIIAPVNFISPYIKEGLMLKAAENESNTFSNPPSNSEIVNSLQLRDNLLQNFIAFITRNTFGASESSANHSVNVNLKIKLKLVT